MMKYLAAEAVITPDAKFRYWLGRQWMPYGPHMAWVMLNPSTADAHLDDMTIRKCISFANRARCGAIDVVNLYAYRATSPQELKRAASPEGPDNKSWVGRTLLQVINNGGFVVAAWGAHGDPSRFLQWASEWHPKAGGTVLDHLLCLGQNKDGSPWHPLRVPYDTKLKPWKP